MTVPEDLRRDLDRRRRMGQGFDLAWRASTRIATADIPQPEHGVWQTFATTTGEAWSPGNVRRRILDPAAKAASAALEAEGRGTLPALTPHSLRRTAASVWIALGWDPARVMRELGHTDPALTLTLYAKAMGTGGQDRADLRALAGTDTPETAGERDQLGTKAPDHVPPGWDTD